jgi:hypothetical protein
VVQEELQSGQRYVSAFLAEAALIVTAILLFDLERQLANYLLAAAMGLQNGLAPATAVQRCALAICPASLRTSEFSWGVGSRARRSAVGGPRFCLRCLGVSLLGPWLLVLPIDLGVTECCGFRSSV